jgi:hypothetical protein
VGTYGPQSMYGERPVTEDEILAPGSMYGQMKALNESICDRYAARYDLEVVKIRPSSILGPGSSIWPARFLDRVALGETGLAPYGEPARDNVVAVDDIAALAPPKHPNNYPASDLNHGYSSYWVGRVAYVRPEGVVQRMTPGSVCSSFQPGACLAWWWR